MLFLFINFGLFLFILFGLTELRAEKGILIIYENLIGKLKVYILNVILNYSWFSGQEGQEVVNTYCGSYHVQG